MIENDLTMRFFTNNSIPLSYCPFFPWVWLMFSKGTYSLLMEKLANYFWWTRCWYRIQEQVRLTYQYFTEIMWKTGKKAKEYLLNIDITAWNMFYELHPSMLICTFRPNDYHSNWYKSFFYDSKYSVTHKIVSLVFYAWPNTHRYCILVTIFQW